VNGPISLGETQAVRAVYGIGSRISSPVRFHHAGHTKRCNLSLLDSGWIGKNKNQRVVPLLNTFFKFLLLAAIEPAIGRAKGFPAADGISDLL
jgi:hypothetical protein